VTCFVRYTGNPIRECEMIGCRAALQRSITSAFVVCPGFQGVFSSPRRTFLSLGQSWPKLQLRLGWAVTSLDLLRNLVDLLHARVQVGQDLMLCFGNIFNSAGLFL
jgi:hypothetical protein